VTKAAALELELARSAAKQSAESPAVEPAGAAAVRPAGAAAEGPAAASIAKPRRQPKDPDGQANKETGSSAAAAGALQGIETS